MQLSYEGFVQRRLRLLDALACLRAAFFRARSVGVGLRLPAWYASQKGCVPPWGVDTIVAW